ncbi:MAG TPA: TlpA disulfide reductase family protein [Geobacteraceae bacterium]
MKRAWLFLIGFLLLMTPGAEARPQRIGETVPAIRLTSLSGKPVNTANLKGKTVVLYFWNDGCGCTEQLVNLRPFINGQKNRPFAFITINEGQPKERVAAFIRENALPYEVLLDVGATTGRKDFGIKVLPTIFIIDKGGILREKLIGVVDSKKLETIIARYL